MKQLFIILFFSHLSYSQWYEQTSGVNSQLADINFIDDNVGYAVGINKILKTSDAGVNWSTSYDCNYILEAVTFTQNRIHVIGYNTATDESIYLKSFDSGFTWLETILPTAGVLSDVFFPSNSIGYTIGSQGVLLKTVDSGSSWNAHGAGIPSMIQSIYFHDDAHGFAVGGFSGGYMYETTDGGLTWNEITINATNFLQGITFPSSNIGYAVGWDGDIFKTTNGGIDWIQQTPAQASGNLDLYFTDDNTGYIVGGDNQVAQIQKTVDGGTTWFSQSPSIYQGLIGVHFTPSNIGFAVGAGGTILNTTNQGGLTISEIDSNPMQVDIYPNPSVNSFELKMNVETSSAENLEIISDKGKVVYNQAYVKGNSIVVSHLPKGLYLVRITLRGQTIIKKLYKI